MQDWYENITTGQRVFLYLISIALIMVYLIGLVPLSVLVYLHLGRRKKLNVSQVESVGEGFEPATGEYQQSAERAENKILFTFMALLAFVFAGSVSFYSAIIRDYGYFYPFIFDMEIVIQGIFMQSVGFLSLVIVVNFLIALTWKRKRNIKTLSKITLGWSLLIIATSLFGLSTVDKESALASKASKKMSKQFQLQDKRYRLKVQIYHHENPPK